MNVLQEISGLTTKSDGSSTCTHDLMDGLQERDFNWSPSCQMNIIKQVTK